MYAYGDVATESNFSIILYILISLNIQFYYLLHILILNTSQKLRFAQKKYKKAEQKNPELPTLNGFQHI